MRRICRAGIYFAALCPAVEVLLLSLVQITVAFDEALIPPKFPDIFSSFSKSLSASDSLRLFVHSLVDDDKLCGCGEYGRVPVNWTEFSANLGAVKRCAPTTNGNGREPNNAAISGGQTGQAQPLVIGVSVAVVVVVVAVICFLAFKKGLCSCTAWDVVRKKSLNLEKQRNSCRPALQQKNLAVVVSASDTSMVSDVGCFGFSKKPKTVLSTKNQEYKNGSKSQNIVLQFYPSDNTELAVGPGKNSSEILSDEQFLSVSKYLGLSQTDVHADAEPPPIDCKGEKTDAFNCHFESSDSTGRVRSDATEKQKTLQPSVLSTVNAENVAWSMLPNGRQFIGSKESLVDHNNIHLFMNDA